MILVTAPSGAGKSTIVRHLLDTYSCLGFSISVTTRPRRDTEQEGRDYYFRTEEEFKQLITDNLLVEWEEVYPGRYYGTLRSEIDRIWSSGRHIIFDIDVRGALYLQRQYPTKSFSIFIRPPSINALIDRLTNRQTETKESLQKRILKARYELSHESLFDVTIVNDDLELALKESEKLLQHYIFDQEVR